MLKSRIDALADGIFAIVMTLLVIEIRVPELHGDITTEALWHALLELWPLFFSYALAFLVLGTYWLAHNFIVSMYAKNVTRTMSLLNIPFFMAVALTPFSTHFLGTYYYSPIGVSVFCANIVITGLFLYILRDYIHRHESIDTDSSFITAHDMHIGTIRILVPVVGAIIATAVSFYNTYVSIAILVVILSINIIPSILNKLLIAVGFHADRHE